MQNEIKYEIKSITSCEALYDVQSFLRYKLIFINERQ